MLFAVNNVSKSVYLAMVFVTVGVAATGPNL